MADQDFNIKVVTTADTSGIQKTSDELKKLRQEALRAAIAPVPSGLRGGPPPTPPTFPRLPTPEVPIEVPGGGGGSAFGSLGGRGFLSQFVGVGALLGFISSLKKASDEISKISEELNEQGSQLVRHAQLYDEQARHAADVSDVLKVSDATLKDIEAAQKKVNELSQQEVGIAAKISDYLQVQLLARQKNAKIGDYEAARQQNLQTAQDQLQQSQQKAMDEILKAEAASNQTHEEKVQILNNEIAAAERVKAAALDNTDPGSYAKAANNLVRLNKLLEETNKLEAQRREKESRAAEETSAEREKDKDFVQQQVNRASPQARAALMNEQAAQLARDRGDERGADLFQKSAERFKASATPAQKEEISVLEKLIEQNGLLRELIQIWR